MRLHTFGEVFTWLRCLLVRRRNIRLKRTDLDALQKQRFRKLVAWANERSPYYRELIAERGIDPANCTPRDFPVLTKADLMEHFDRIVTDPRLTKKRITEFLHQSEDPNELLDGKYYVLHSSGTSGRVCYVVYSLAEWIHGCSQSTHLVKPGLRKRIAFVAVTRGHFAGISMMLTANQGTNALFYNVKTFDTSLPFSQVVRELNEFRPRILSGYPTTLKMLGEAKAAGELDIAPELICCGGEPLSVDDRAWLKTTFDAPVANTYAASEMLYMGISFPDEEGMVLFEDNVMFDFEHDHTLCTNLFNYTMPLINYRIDDVLVPDLDAESRYEHLVVREIVGRAEHALRFTNQFGEPDFIHPFVIVELFVPGLAQWQCVLRDDTSFTMRAKYDPALSDDERDGVRDDLRTRLETILTEKNMQNVTFDIEEVDEFLLDPHSGKFRMVVHEPAAVTI